MSAFPHLPLGQRIPASPHAVSCSLPTMRDVRGYEEKDPAVTKHLTSGYPRFVVHPFSRQLTQHFVATIPALASRTLWLVSSAHMARALAAHLNQTASGLRGETFTPAGAAVFEREGLHGVSHSVDAEAFTRAKTFLQNIGGFVSSREAEDHLVSLGLLPASYPEATFAGNPIAEIHNVLHRVLPRVPCHPPPADNVTEVDRILHYASLPAFADLHLAPSGMNAIYTTFRASAALQAGRGRTIWLQLGWLYLDTIAILQKFTTTPEDYVYIRDPLDLEGITRIFHRHGDRIAGVVAELPTNPLIQTPDLAAIAELCSRHRVHLILDPSVASIFSLDIFRYSTVVTSSLTKYTASEGDVIAGLAAVNLAAPDGPELSRRIAAEIEPVYPRDLARLAAQIGATESVLARVNANAAQVVEFLRAHPKIRDVFWALHPASRDNYRKLARTPDGTGGMITFTLKELGALENFYDRLRLPKGPSFGMKTTLICPFMYLAHYDLVTTPAGLAELAASKLDPDLLRLCVGTEPAEEIIAALAEALS